ncbi:MULTISPECIES: PatB family C-S lyase [Nitrosomonas]|uniref:cysteine-S-conjugate beta-lyase n=1 Tax=Nitrosomonas communis TaxID=44574 RepID=A0A0F7KFK7_9PROT|nr:MULTISPECIES: PatB family C-S lyase [Nitrosomonas]AKH38271.1 aminotransferase [Nitrosomonas communis]TYP89522.1 cystathionine beta-lyase [Nitrosomonas communis]UVS60252.1 PatB family C-S lyase [Nitrosomonas sp. PLL12]
MSDLFDRDIKRIGTNSTKFDGRLSTFGNANVMPLWVADMDFAAPAEITHALIGRATHPIYGYTLIPESLYQSLIDWLWLRYQWKVEREWIILSPGVVPSITTTTMALTQTGEQVIIQPPVYFPFFSAVTKTDRQLILNPLHLAKGRYTIDFDQLEQIGTNARMLLFCSPHNPVGRVWSKSELTQLIEMAGRHNWVIISDEIHADLVYPENPHRPLASLTENPENIITAIAPSKTFNIPGLHLSALIVPNKIHRTAITHFFDMMHISAANPFSMVAFETAYRSGATWLNELMLYLKNTRDQVDGYLAEHLPDIQLIKPEGTYLLWLDCRALNMNDKQLKHFFVHEAEVGLSPGALFGKNGSGFMRMNIGTPRHNIMTALENIRKAYKRVKVRSGRIL